MSRALAVPALAVLVLALSHPARAADEPKDVVAKAIKAHGGEDALSKYKAGQIKSKGTITIPGVGETEYSQEVSYMLPDKFRDSMELKIGGQTISVFTLINGDKVTLEINGKALEGQEDKVKEAIKNVGHMMEVSRMVTLKDKAYDLSLIGEDKVEGKKVIGVRVSKKGQSDVSLYFDKETHLLAKIEYRTTDPNTGNEITEERFPSGYEKNKDGLPVAKKVLVKRDGKTFLEGEVLETKYFEKLDDADFKK
ncbi:MAG: hypothetical protein K2V38_16885 [Gemmataceae bacterium]|nr:hypothetical protein [Gemmataceae bacterium]